MVDRVRLEHFRNLICLSVADGKIEQAEEEFLSKIANALGIAPERLEIMLTHAHEYIYLVPQNLKDREKQLREMIAIALADGKFSNPERNLIRSIASKLGFEREEAEQLIEEYSRKPEH